MMIELPILHTKSPARAQNKCMLIFRLFFLFWHFITCNGVAHILGTEGKTTTFIISRSSISSHGLSFQPILILA